MLGNQPALQTPGPQPPGIPQVAAAMGQAQPVRPPSKCCWSCLCFSGVFGLKLILRLCLKSVLLTILVLCCRWAYVHANRAYQSYAGFSRYLFSSLKCNLWVQNNCWGGKADLVLGWWNCWVCPFSASFFVTALHVSAVLTISVQHFAGDWELIQCFQREGSSSKNAVDILF